MDINWLDANYLAWLIPVPPLISFLLIILFTGKNKTLSHITGLTAVTLSFLMALGVFFRTVFTDNFGQYAYGNNITWMDIGAEAFKMGVLVDPLTAVMLFMVPLAILMIFIYSVGYMGAYPEDDPHQIRYSRFFAYLSLFAGGMLTLVVADNLLLLFVGWEIMGLCSYLLIGFLFERKSSQQAGIKAFMTTRAADVFMLVGIGYLFAEAGTLNFRELLYEPGILETLGDPDQSGFLGLSAAAIIGTFLVIGTLGKAAQFPFHAWLPDAMEGPTPVSAMIHAAAMVSAGVYAVIRMYPLLEAGGNPHYGDYTLPLMIMGVLGGVTALGAAILGVGQNDIKRVLAYSTISQLGFMIAALGIGAYVAAAFHLITHAFFKALLFMSSGAVIHAMEHGEHHLHHAHGHDHDHDHTHDEHDAHHEESYDYNAVPHRVQPGEVAPYGTDFVGLNGEAPEYEDWEPRIPEGIQEEFVATPNDMRLMGGLVRNIPITAYAMLAGSLSLAGLPFISAGFWSKDEIIADSFLFLTRPDDFTAGAPWLHIYVFFMLITAATLTAFYTLRMWLLTFTGDYRSAIAEHATLKNHVDEAELEAMKTPFQKFWAEYRNSALMQLPLVVLAFFAITAGWAGIHADFDGLSLLTGGNNFFKNFIGGTLAHKPVAPPFNWFPVIFSMLAFGIGAGLAYRTYGVPQEGGQKDPAHEFLGDEVWEAMQKRFYFDRLYLSIFYVPFEWFARKIAYTGIDKETIDWMLEATARVFNNTGEAIKRFNYVVIDGVGDGIPAAIMAGGRWFRNIQSGRIQQYLLFTAIMILAIGLFLILQVF